MDFKRIIENGYGKLAEKLPETDKEFLRGYKYAMEMLSGFKDNIDDYINNDIKPLADIEKATAECTIDNSIKWLDMSYDELLVCLVDYNHYSIDENGNITDDNETDVER